MSLTERSPLPRAEVLASGSRQLIRTEGNRTTVYDLVDTVRLPRHGKVEVTQKPRSWNFKPTLGRASECSPSKLCGPGKAEIR
jgi:hypothetical protein